MENNVYIFKTTNFDKFKKLFIVLDDRWIEIAWYLVSGIIFLLLCFGSFSFWILFFCFCGNIIWLISNVFGVLYAGWIMFCRACFFRFLLRLVCSNVVLVPSLGVHGRCYCHWEYVLYILPDWTKIKIKAS